MANDEIFVCTAIWQFVQLGGVDIKDGTFTLFNLSKKRVDFKKIDALPQQNDIGSSITDDGKESIKVTLAGADRMAAKAGVGIANIGVIPA